MKKSEMKGKVFSLTIAVLMVGLILGGLVSTGHLGNAQLVLSDSAQVYLVPQDSVAPLCETVPVEIRVNATDFQAGQIKLIYNPACANVTNWELNTEVFPLGTWDSDTPGEEWITFSALGPLSGDYLIGTLTIHCISEEECLTALDFIEDPATGSALFDSLGSVIPATWTDGTFQCAGKPDLIIEKIASWADGILTVTYTVTNIGNAAAGPSTTCVYVDGTHIVGCDSAVPGLAAGGIYSATTSCFVDCPSCTAIEVKVCADDYDDVIESDEGNNCEVNIVDCPLCLPDLVITEIKCDRENDRVAYVVKNMGGGVALPGHYTTLWVNHEEVCDDQVLDSLGPGQTYAGWFNCYIWPPCQTIEVRVCADNYHSIEESNEDNNCEEELCSCNGVYFDPQHSRAAPCTSTEVDIRGNATDFMGGQIRFVYNPACVNVTSWELNEDDFPLGTWESSTPGEEWITFTGLEAASGDYLIGTLTIHCVRCVSEEECTTALEFIENGATGSALFDDTGSQIAATWTDGIIDCKGLCGDVAPCPDCDYTVNMGDVILLLSYVGHPGQYELCCDWCGDVAPCPASDGTINMGDVILLLSYVGHPGQYELCCG